MTSYPSWSYYPSNEEPPSWCGEFAAVVAAQKDSIDSRAVDGTTSDKALAALRPGLEALGFTVETGKTKLGKIRRPVLFGENGVERLAYEVDGVHDELGIVLEVEAGRGARGNAVYRDLIRTSLIVGARFLVLAVMLEYRHNQSGRVQRVPSYNDARAQIDAIYASQRLVLPFEGVLLVGY